MVQRRLVGKGADGTFPEAVLAVFCVISSQFCRRILASGKVCPTNLCRPELINFPTMVTELSP